jgi:hypothetical protein
MWSASTSSLRNAGIRANLTELLWVVRQQMTKPPPVNSEAKVCGSHWAMSKAAVAPGQMIETATPVHEEDGNQAAPRLNHVLHEVIPACMTQDALHAFIRQDVRAFDPTVVPDKQKFLRVLPVTMLDGIKKYPLNCIPQIE